MLYALMIYGDEAKAAQATPAEVEAEIAEHYVFTEEITKRGIYKGGEALHDTGKATTVRMHNGKYVVTDGPFAETKAQLGGFYIIDCKDLDEAIEVAKMCPGSKTGSVELRPIMVIG